MIFSSMKLTNGCEILKYVSIADLLMYIIKYNKQDDKSGKWMPV